MAVPEPESAHGEPQSQQPHPSSKTSGTVPPGHFLHPKDCRACPDVQHMMATFKHLTAKKDHAATVPSGKRSSSSTAGGDLTVAAAAAFENRATASQDTNSTAPPSSSAYEPLPCPPESAELGNATWSFLHSMAAYYPDEPTAPQKSLMRSMMEGLAEFYPCGYCAEHLRQQMEQSPPEVSSASALSLWLCRIHNEVNDMLGKPIFDCSKVMQRWRDGPPDGSCG